MGFSLVVCRSFVANSRIRLSGRRHFRDSPSRSTGVLHDGSGSALCLAIMGSWILLVEQYLEKAAIEDWQCVLT